MSVFPVTLFETKSFFLSPTSKLLFMSHWPELGPLPGLTNYCKKQLTNGITWELRSIVKSREATWREVGWRKKTEVVLGKKKGNVDAG